MEQNNMKNGNFGEEDLEKKVGFWGRAKYIVGPAALTIISGFVPEIKHKYHDLPKKNQDTYRTVALAGSTILGAALAIYSGYTLIKNKNSEKKYR